MPLFQHLFSLLPLTLALSLASCDFEHSGNTISDFTGDYRYSSGIGEFFDCHSRKKYYVFNSSEHKKIITQYNKLGITNKDDVFLKVKGYLKAIEQLEGIDPEIEFIPTKLLSMNPSRGCTRAMREGH